MTPYQNQPSAQTKKAGFTLIELSIVLVIIGLIVGGVLVGQDLIKAAEVRATLGQYEKYNAAINTFRTKYNGMPGDLAAAQATAFGLFSTGMGGGTGEGDGNGLLQTSDGTSLQLGEPLVFWAHLSAASLIDGSLGANLATNGASDAASATGTFVPAAKIGRGNYWWAGSASGLNYYLLSGGENPISADGAVTYSQALTPIEAFNIDTKVDDGLPNVGIVQARGESNDITMFDTLASANVGEAGASVSAEAAGDCLVHATASTSTAATYARGTTAGNSPGCTLRMRFN